MIKKILITLLFTISFVTFFSTETFAVQDPRCVAKRTTDSQFTGEVCTASGITDKTCVNVNGCLYTATECRDNCERKYPVQDCSSAPAACSRPGPGPGGSSGTQTDVEKVFGQIAPPAAIQNLGYGDKGISRFLNIFIELLFMIGGIAFVFMIIWGAVELLISGGNKEQVASGKNRIMYAIIGIVLMAIAFAIIEVIGRFTGFKFFG